MKIGVIFCAYNSEPYVRDALSSFIEDDRFIVSAVSVPFKEYDQQEFYEDETTNILREYKEKGLIENLVDSPRFVLEHEARNLALEYLKKEKVDFVMLVDGDEVYQKSDLDNIVEFISNDDSLWYKIALKNFVFDKEHYLEEPFCPPRIFRMDSKDYEGVSFYWDNDFTFQHKIFRARKNHNQFLCKQIPQELVWVTHYSWMNDEIGKRKAEYQLSHMGICSYKWEDGLKINEDFYKKAGQEIPKILKIN
jgi:glycosyltransferase involved in cell wall biosynthesis